LKKRILVLCHDVVGKNMAGPGMRFSHVAKILRGKFDVTLGVFSESNKGADDVVVVDPSDADSFKPFIDAADFIFAQWLSNPMLDYATAQGKRIIFDLYAPVPIEYLASLEFAADAITPEKDEEFNAIIAMYNRYFAVGDAFTCSNERQRDFWTGYITANGLLKPSNFKQKRLLGNFLLCPMGTSVGPIPKKLVLRQTLGLKKSDFVLVFTGGIYDWYDGRLMVKAMSLLKDPSIKLVFLGNKHPNSIYTKETAETTATRKLSAKLGLTGKTVFFQEGWIPYEDRTAYFMDGDASVYADKESLETRFSHRTRVLDHFWMEIPTICSGGDSLAAIVAEKQLGLVAERTPEAFAAAITTLRTDKAAYAQIKRNLHACKAEFTWEKTLQPLVNYIAAIEPGTPPAAGPATTEAKPPRVGLKQRVRRSAKMLLLGK